MAAEVVTELGIPSKYTKKSKRSDRVEAVVSKSWLRQIVKHRRIPEFFLHDKLSEDEISALFKQGEHFSSGWQKIIITVIRKEDKQVIPLPRVRPGAKDSQLSLSQILQYVSHTNYKNLWKEAYKRNSFSFLQNEPFEKSYVQLTDQSSLVREALSRTYGAPLIKLTESQVYNESKFSPHANLLPASFIIESGASFFVIHEFRIEHTVLDCVTFSPALLSESYAKPMFIIYQLLRLMRHLHDMGLVLGDISLSDIYIGKDLWIQVIPRLIDNICLSPIESDPSPSPTVSPDEAVGLDQLTSSWLLGALSNYDYLCCLNQRAGRVFGDPRAHFVLPWVSDLSSRSGAEWRDLSKSKFRLNKGDRQLDLTYELTPAPNSPQIPHHVTDVLSEITYYVYLSRVTPKSVLCKYVRPQWVPAEYPASIQRLQAWSPDECIPEFFTDPSVFKSIHHDLGDLEVPSWCSSPQEFINKHRAMLESSYVSERLHYWIDLTFGYKLSGPAAVKAKNVCLQLVDGHKDLCGSGVVQLFTSPHPYKLPLSPFWGKTPPRIHTQRRKPEEDDGHSSGLEEEEQPSVSLSLSRLISRSRNSLITSPLSTTPIDSDRSTIPLPKEYNPAGALNVVESLLSFTWSSCFKRPNFDHRQSNSEAQLNQCKQIVASKRAKEMQVLGCLMVEIFLPEKVRIFGPVEQSFERRLASCRSVIFNCRNPPLPKYVKTLVFLLLHKGDFPAENWSGVPPPSAHQLLQPLLTSPLLLHFPPLFPNLYSSLVSLFSYSRACSEIGGHDVSLSIKLNHLKVMSLARNIETLVETKETLELILPYVIEMLNSPQMDVLASWYLFDHLARALGPKKTSEMLLETMIRLYDCETPREPQLLKKRVKLYHRSFLIRLIVRFGLSVFLESFVLPLVEAVGGYHDIDQAGHSHLGCDVEEAVEADAGLPLSPLDEDLSADSERNSSVLKDSENEAEPELFHLEDESIGPKSASSIQDLLIDNLDAHSLDEKEGDDNGLKPVNLSSDRNWRRKSFASIKYLHVDTDRTDMEYSKVYVGEVCEVSGESVVWLAGRLGPVLTSRYLARNLLRMLGLCYTGRENLAFRSDSVSSLIGDDNAFHILRSLTAITALYGEQVIVVQYMGHAMELVSICRRKVTGVLEGALVGCLSLLSQVVGSLSDQSFSEALTDSLLKGLLHPALRLVASFSAVLPSGQEGRKALAVKILSVLIALTRRADHRQRLVLLQTVQRFFLAFSKAHEVAQKALDIPSDCELKTKNFNKLKDDFSESPPSSFNPSDPQRIDAQEELKASLSPEFAYLAYKPFADFFGESVMEQNLKNHRFIRHLCDQYLKDRTTSGYTIPGTCEIEPPEMVDAFAEAPIQVGSFGNAIVIGNRIEIQESSKTPSPGVMEEGRSRMNENNRHLHGNWLAYWEHELGRSAKDTRLNIKQIKLQCFAGHANSVKHMVVLGSENSFMSASRDKTVKLWSLRSQGDGSHVSTPQWSYTGHRKSVLCLGWVERTRLTVSSDSSVHLWDPFVGRPVAALGADGAAVNVLRPLPTPSAAVLCATTDGSVKTLDTRSGGFVNELKVSQNPGGLIRCLVVSPNSTWLGVGQASGVLTILDLICGGIIASWKAHDAEVLQMVAVDEKTIISSALDQSVSVWNVHDGKLLYYLKGPTEPVHCLEVVGGEVVSGTTANRIGVHTSIDAEASFSSTRLRSDTFKGVLTSMAVLPLNRLILLGADSGVITLIC